MSMPIAVDELRVVHVAVHTDLTATEIDEIRSVARAGGIVWCLRPTALDGTVLAAYFEGDDVATGWLPYTREDVRTWLAAWGRAAA